MQVNVHEAKTHLSRLLARVEAGEEIVIARLIPYEKRPPRRLPGSAKGKVCIHPDFEAPLPEEILADFEG